MPGACNYHSYRILETALRMHSLNDIFDLVTRKLELVEGPK